MSVVGIVGAGPRGVTALNALASLATTPVTIHLFGAINDNGINVAGQGTPYSINQPLFSRLNASSSVVDMFAQFRQAEIEVRQANPSHDPEPARDRTDTDTPHAIVGDNFDQWALRYHPDLVDSFPPRAYIGRYFTDCMDYIRSRLPDHVKLVEHSRVRSITGQDGNWVIDTDHERITVDELLLTLGHAQEPPNKLTPHDVAGQADAVIDSPYPLSRMDEIPDGARVATRGAGLSFIDIALAFTEGRGGIFSEDGSTYTPSGRECELYPTGLEGIFLDAKPNIDVLDTVHDPTWWDEVAHQILNSTDLANILTILRESTSSVLKELDYPAPKATYDTIVAGPSPEPGQAREWLAGSLHDDPRHPHPRTIVAGTIIKLFDPLLETVRNREWPQDEWTTFSTLIESVNNYGFGPPPINARKILTLIDAGFIHTEWLDAGVDALDLPEKVDVMVEGLLAPPGYWPEAYPGLEGIADILAVWADPERRPGVRVDDNGSVLDKDLHPVGSVAAIGRITEDWVVSTDSLNFSVHPHIMGWARRVAGN